MARTWPVPLARRQITFNTQQLVLSVAGVAFAVLLMFMETGFQNGVLDSTTQVVWKLDADLILLHKQRYTVDGASTFPRNRLTEALECPGVASAVPLYISDGGYWRLPGTGDRAALRVYGYDPDDSVLLVDGLAQQREALRLPGSVVFDDKSRPYFGKHDTGTETELNEHTVRVVGTVKLGPDFTTDGNVFTGTATFFSVMEGTDPDDVGLGLLKVSPGRDPNQVRDTLQPSLPPDLVVYTKAQFDQEIRDFFNSNGSTAAVFGMGVMIGFLIGGFICYQVLYTDVTDHLSQFATLKAVGYSNLYLMKVVAQQALILSLLGFVVGLVPAWLLCGYIENSTGLVMRMTPPRLATVFVLTVMMNQIAGAVAVRRVLKADPADLF